MFSKSCNLYFNDWDDRQAKFDTNDVDNANDYFGLASGFFPKSLII